MTFDRADRVQAKWIAIAEVALAFAIMHLSFRAFKRFTALGQMEYQTGVDLSPGVSMILAAVAFIALRRRRFADFAITLRPFPRSVNVGLAAVVVYSAFGAAAMGCGLRIDRTWTDPVNGAIVAALNLLVTGLMLWALRWAQPVLERMPGWLGVAVVGGIALAAVALRVAAGTLSVPAALAAVGIVVGAATAEEVFFRGYVQSRINAACGRPWSVLGVRFGPGLLAAAVLFGLIHVLNPYDYYRGEGRLAWWWGLVAASSLFLGLLREKTGSIVTPAILHAFMNLAARTPRVLPNP